MLPVPFYLLLTNLAYVCFRSTSICWILDFVSPVLITCNDPHAPLLQLILAKYWLWIRDGAVAYHYLHRSLVESVAPMPSPRVHQRQTRHETKLLALTTGALNAATPASS
jgi:hypothetical protein